MAPVAIGIKVVKGGLAWAYIVHEDGRVEWLGKYRHPDHWD